MKSRRIALILFVVFALAALCGSAFLIKHPESQAASSALPELWRAPQFELTSMANEPFSSEQLAGKVWVAEFFFTSCEGVCPTMNAEMAKLQEMFPDAGSLHFVSISVNPEFDTPEVLREYAERFNADPSRWHFLTGSIDTIKSLSSDGFKLGSVDSPMMHSSRFVLVDRRGMIRGFYDATDKDAMAELHKQLARILE